MDTLLLQLKGPLQAWGIQSDYTVRDSGLEPTKSGVLGLVCSALGRPREADLSDLAQLRMGVRVDQEGKLLRDFHVVLDVMGDDGKVRNNPVVTNRYYLADAVFLVGLEGESNLLTQIQAALQKPRWALFLGRKAFPPSAPVWLPDGHRQGEPLEKALREYPSLVKTDGKPVSLRLVTESTDGEQSRQDVPISFANRQFTRRRVTTSYVEVKEEVQCLF